MCCRVECPAQESKVSAEMAIVVELRRPQGAGEIVRGEGFRQPQGASELVRGEGLSPHRGASEIVRGEE